MDEESKNINNEDEESLVDSSSNSNTINRGIDNFGNSVNNLKNNQSHQLSGGKSLGTNFKKDAKNNELANKLTRKPVSPSSRLGSGLQSEQGENEKGTNSGIKGGLTSKIAGGGIKGSLAANLLGNKKKKEEKAGEAPDIFEKATRKTKILISIIGAIGPVLFPIVVIIILISVIVLPISFAVGEIKNFIQRASNFNEFNGFKTNHELADELYEKADKAVSIYPDLNRESLLGVLYYSYITPEEYLDSLSDVENTDAEDKLNFGRMKKTLYTMASQLIYSTVTFDNNILRIEDDIIDPDTGKVVGKKVRYECPGGAYKISTRKQLCKDGIANYTDGPGDLDYSSADMCYDITSDANIEPYLNESGFDKNMKCVTVEFENGEAIFFHLYA